MTLLHHIVMENQLAEMQEIFHSPFTGHDRMRDLVLKNPYLLPVLSRFEIALGFGESSVDDVCKRDGVDTMTFLTVCNFFSAREAHADDVDIPDLVRYLKSAHRYFLDYVLPTIRTKLISAISTGKHCNFTWMLIKFYDEYVEEVRRHMAYEEDNVFEYVLQLCQGIRTSDFTIDQFVENHLPIAEKLRDIKELFIGHYTAEHGRVDMLNTVLFDLIICERDLLYHCALEDRIFVPAVKALESKTVRTEQADMAESDADGAGEESTNTLDDHGDVVLTRRERDIVEAIARGLSNKEIADKLFLSVHTVTTHRRNISNKLNIHSTSGLTIYAIMHNILSLDEGSAIIQ